MTNISQDETYRKLKQIPWEEMDNRLNNMNFGPSEYCFDVSANGARPAIFNSRKGELVRHLQRVKLLNEHGWTFEEFVLEAEKKNILLAISEYNKRIQFPLELVERAKEFFPNARFIQAEIILE